MSKSPIRYLPPAIAAMAAVAMFLTVAIAGEVRAGSLVLENSWARATVPAAKVGGAYLTIANSGAQADRLLSASVAPEIAARAEIHEMAVKDGIMTMREVEGGLEIPAGGKLMLQPGGEGGYHVMMMGLKAPLKVGEKFTGKLVFEKAGEVSVEFEVKAKARAGNEAGHGG